MNADFDPDHLAGLVLALLARAESGTVVTVRRSGAVVAAPPGTVSPAFERREPLLATFVANHQQPSRDAVRHRIEQGQAKLQPLP